MYSIRSNPPEEVKRKLINYDEITQRLLFARDITTEEEAEYFFKKEWIPCDPFQYGDMEKAVGRIIQAVQKDEVIGIYHDYDCDGIPAAAALYSTLSACNHKQICTFVPNRNLHGFGLHAVGIQKMIDAGVTVMCVLDCGTSEYENIQKITDAGIDVIILDHHLPGEQTPEAYALLNPVVEKDIPTPHPCAAGMVYIFIQALLHTAHNIKDDRFPPIGWEKWQLDVVALATVSDMVPLRGFNRQLVHHGINVMRKSPRPGIQAFCNELRISQKNLTQEDMSFSIIPRINAASRMGDAHIAFQLLTTDSPQEAQELAKRLTSLNNKRKSVVASMVKKANASAAHKKEEHEIWVFGNREWKPSLVGLVAQKAVETYNKTVFVWGQAEGESGCVKGSCRSKSRDTFALMQSTPHLFVEAGGHKMAGGFSLKPGAELILEEELNKAAQAQEKIEHTHMVDTQCLIREIPDLLQLAEKFSPFGLGNEQVTITLHNCTLTHMVGFGKKGEHMRYVFTDTTGNIEGIKFFATQTTHVQGDTLKAVIGIVEWDSFKNKPRIRVVDIT